MCQYPGEGEGCIIQGMNKWIKLLIAILITQGAGFLGSVFTTPKIGGWYAELAKPVFNPPNWIFAPVWTSLYILMGISLWLVWTAKSPGKEKIRAYIAFGVQLVLNTLWSVAFFGLESPLLALSVLVSLWIMILVTMFHFSNISRAAVWLLLPYILWVSFAGLLNWSIWRLDTNSPASAEVSWVSGTNTDGTVSFRYPTDFGTKYIHPVDWPPEARLLEEPFVCTPGGESEVLPAGMTEEKTINGNVFCVTKESEGAAGTTYTMYAYARDFLGKTLIFTWSSRAVQCMNYDDPEKSECLAERDVFDPDGLLSRISETAESGLVE